MPVSDTNSGLLRIIREKSGQPVELCFQCQKCASGCPMGELTDLYPNQVVRLLQLGLTGRLLQSSAIWLCTGCETCSARCPNGIKIPEITDVLRTLAFTRKVFPREKNIPVFHQLFLETVKNRGRVHETLLMVKYKLKTGDLFSDLQPGLKMLFRGKLPLFAKGVPNKREIRKIFKVARGN